MTDISTAMTEFLFIDTGAFLARYVDRDQHHAVARACWEQLGSDSRRLITSNFVLDETFTLLARRAGYPFAASRAREILTSQELEVLRPDSDREHKALDLFEKYADQAVSFTDCVSFALMASHGIAEAFTFDQHFERAGFTRWPG